MMFLSECKNNRIPYVILCLITFGFYSVWAYGLHHTTPANWNDWRLAIVGGVIYLGLIYALAVDYSVINMLCAMAVLWGMMALYCVLLTFVAWRLSERNRCGQRHGSGVFARRERSHALLLTGGVKCHRN